MSAESTKENNIDEITEEDIPKDKKYDCVIVNTYFEVDDLQDDSIISEGNKYTEKTRNLIEKAAGVTTEGGILFVYGLPRYLPFFSVHLNALEAQNCKFLFKYWIALEFNSGNKPNILKNSHIGLLMYLKTKSTILPTPFHLRTKEVRSPYKECAACGKNIKDWGGKKHLMNPLGTAFSDVWSDLNIDIDKAKNIPELIIKRIQNLVNKGKSKILIIKQKKIERKNKENE